LTADGGSDLRYAAFLTKILFDSMAPRPKLQRAFSLSVAAAFWVFLVVSAPHRVHHFFEQFPATEQRVGHAHAHAHADGSQHRHHDHHDSRPKQQNDCVVLTVAQNVHASLVQVFDFAVIASAVARYGESLVTAVSSFNPSPFSQRAPPQA
jgi:hypothetical protein